MICEPITIAMSAPTGDGGAAAVLCSEEFVTRNNLQVINSVVHVYCMQSVFKAYAFDDHYRWGTLFGKDRQNT